MARRGIGVLVSLLREDEQRELRLEDEATACSRCQIDYIAVPVPDLGAPLDSGLFVQTVRGLADRLRDGAHLAVHCRQSVGRSGMLAVSIAITLGSPLDSALDIVSRARGVSVPETKEQFDWLRRNAGALSASA